MLCPHTLLQMVSDVLTEVVFSVIDAGLISESDVEEPVEVGMDLNLAVLAVDGDVCTDLEAVGGVPPMQIVEAFGT